MAREVKGFWANAQKLFEWRVKQKLERKHKEALDQHLQFIVDKTEKYSTLLAESLAESASGQVKNDISLHLYQGCGSVLIVCGSGSTKFSECGSGSKTKNHQIFQNQK